jgi:hypothetical protein
MKHKDFAVFILSHGRPDNVYTYNSLLKSGYTGKIYIIIDNEDQTADKYYSNFGHKVIMFDKKEIASGIDTMDNFSSRKAIIYARHANFKIAKDLGVKYFLQLDDDYTGFQYKINEDKGYPTGHGEIRKDLDKIFDFMLDYFIETKAIAIAMAQLGGDFIGGGQSNMFGKIKRKCMNTWFMDVDRPINFIGKMNEDYTTSVYYGFLGELFFTIPFLSIRQIQTQQGAGGMSDLYLANGTYVKTFYSIMALPSCVKVSLLLGTNRLHHTTKWENAVPKIISEENKKAIVNSSIKCEIKVISG